MRFQFPSIRISRFYRLPRPSSQSYTCLNISFSLLLVRSSLENAIIGKFAVGSLSNLGSLEEFGCNTVLEGCWACFF